MCETDLKRSVFIFLGKGVGAFDIKKKEAAIITLGGGEKDSMSKE